MCCLTPRLSIATSAARRTAPARLHRGTSLDATSAALAAQLLGHLITRSAAAARADRQIRLQEALNQLQSIDREALAMRHFEQMSNGEIAATLGLDNSAASKRCARALLPLNDILCNMPGGLESLE